MMLTPSRPYLLADLGYLLCFFILYLTSAYECLTDDGYLVMAIPDKRCTFDRFREVTPFRDALDVYINGDTASARLVFDCTFSRHPCNSPSKYLQNLMSFLPVATDGAKYINAYTDYREVQNGAWLSAHNWVFTYPSFIAFLRDCIRSGLLSYALEYSAPPVTGSSEFHIVLKKSPSMQTDESVRVHEIIKLQLMLDEIDGISFYSDLLDFCGSSDCIYIYGTGDVGKPCITQ